MLLRRVPNFFSGNLHNVATTAQIPVFIHLTLKPAFPAQADSQSTVPSIVIQAKSLTDFQPSPLSSAKNTGFS
jgi:hypothetical protein